jgi:membrane fusion protein, multidrug efflux system
LHDRRAGERHRRQKTVEDGANVSPGQQLMAVVSLRDIRIAADFKETRLRLMKPGDRVLLSIESYGRECRGKVTGIGGASGSSRSLLPENATGNFVKGSAAHPCPDRY